METAPGGLEFLTRDGYLEARAVGAYSLDLMRSQLERAVAECKERNVDRLLFDITDLADYRPTTAERFQIGTSRLAAAAYGRGAVSRVNG